MTRLRRLVAFLRGHLHRNVVAAEIREEMEFHLHARAAEYARHGMTPDEARLKAHRQFGHRGVLQDEAYDIRGASLWDTLSQDLRYAARRLRATPGFTIVAMLTLALGIGANATLFSLMNGVLLRPVPGVRLDYLAAILVTEHGVPRPFSGLTNDQRATLESQHLPGIESFFTSDALVGALSAGGHAEVVSGELVSGSYFSALGVTPVAGRLLNAMDDHDAASGTGIVISERLWRRWFNADPAAVGARAAMAGTPLTIVGIAPDAFHGTWLPTMLTQDVWIPAAAADRVRTIQGIPASGAHRTFAHLRPESARPATAAAISTIGHGLYAHEPTRGLTLQPAEAAMLFDEFKGPGLAIGTALVSLSGLVFLIACANLTNLFLARVLTRQTEIATRLALGASRARIFRLVATEALVVSGLAVLGSIVVTILTTSALVRIPMPALDGLTPRFDPSPDWRVVGYAIAIAVGASLAIGLAPAWGASRLDPMRVTAAVGSAGLESRRGHRLRSWLVSAQVGMSIVLLVLASLYVQSATRGARFDPGYDGTHVAMASVDLRLQGIDESRGRILERRLLDAARSVPETSQAVLVSGFGALSGETKQVMPEGDGAAELPVRHRFVRVTQTTPGLFGLVRIPLVAGRDFTDTDGPGAPSVAIVDEAVATRAWPNQSSLGQRFRLAPDGPLFEVVGLVRGIANRPTSGDTGLSFVYVPAAQQYSPRATLLVSTPRDPHAPAEILRGAISAVDSELAVKDVGVLSDIMAVLIAPLRVTALVLGALGVLGFAIAALGLHSVMAYFVTRRIRDFGIRRALGANARHIYIIVLRSAGRMLALGVCVGVAIAFVGSSLLERLLFGITPHDPLTFVAVPLTLVAVGLVASGVAARRAARVEPSEALRNL